MSNLSSSEKADLLRILDSDLFKKACVLAGYLAGPSMTSATDANILGIQLAFEKGVREAPEFLRELTTPDSERPAPLRPKSLLRSPALKPE